MNRRALSKLVYSIIGTLLAIVGIIYLIGWLLPADHRAERSATIAAPPDSVYALIADVERYPAWRSNVTAVEVLSRDPELRFREHDEQDAILFVIDSAMPNEQWVSRIADDTLPFGGRWVFTLRPADADSARTELRIVEEGEVYTPFYRFVSRFVIGHSAGIERFLEDVQARFSTGEESAPAPR